MKKADAFCKVLNLLDNDEKEKLLSSAKGLLKAQNVVRINSAKPKSSNKQKSNAVKD